MASPLTDNQRAVLMTKMSDATAGLVLGWSAARVRRERAVITGAPADQQAMSVVQAAPAHEPEPPPMAAEPVRSPPPRPVPMPEPYNPVSPKKLRFARWFIRARWSVEETADLFDLYPEELALALGRAAEAA